MEYRPPPRRGHGPTARNTAPDEVASWLVDWVEEGSSAVADGILGSVVAPDVEEPPLAERLALFHGMLFHPDGTPNPQGHDAFVARYGAEAYADTVKALAERGLGPPTGGG